MFILPLMLRERKEGGNVYIAFNVMGKDRQEMFILPLMLREKTGRKCLYCL